jgi:hypothetical protein
VIIIALVLSFIVAGEYAWMPFDSAGWKYYLFLMHLDLALFWCLSLLPKTDQTDGLMTVSLSSAICCLAMMLVSFLVAFDAVKWIPLYNAGYETFGRTSALLTAIQVLMLFWDQLIELGRNGLNMASWFLDRIRGLYYLQGFRGLKEAQGNEEGRS